MPSRTHKRVAVSAVRRNIWAIGRRDVGAYSAIPLSLPKGPVGGSTNRPPYKLARLRHAEDFSRVRIFHFGSGRESADIDVMSIWRKRTGNESLFAGNGNSKRRIPFFAFGRRRNRRDPHRRSEAWRGRTHWFRGGTWSDRAWRSFRLFHGSSLGTAFPAGVTRRLWLPRFRD